MGISSEYSGDHSGFADSVTRQAFKPTNNYNVCLSCLSQISLLDIYSLLRSVIYLGFCNQMTVVLVLKHN